MVSRSNKQTSSFAFFSVNLAQFCGFSLGFSAVASFGGSLVAAHLGLSALILDYIRFLGFVYLLLGPSRVASRCKVTNPPFSCFVFRIYIYFSCSILFTYSVSVGPPVLSNSLNLGWV
jgi:hypothetical protein